MKIPYVVSPNVLKAYETSTVMRDSNPEAGRRIIAEDFTWDDNITPKPLSIICIEALSQIFHRKNPLNLILQKDVDLLMDFYPADVPLKYSVPLIKDEQYWKRSFETKFPRLKELRVDSWKQKFLATTLRDYLENTKPSVFREDEASELAALVSPYIAELIVCQLQIANQPVPPPYVPDVVEDVCEMSVPKIYDHIPLEPILSKLYKLGEISLVFGLNGLNDNYLKRYFEFTLSDCESLCRGLEHLPSLKLFRINRSNLDCIKAKLILQNLVKKETIEVLDFNHCKIGNYGMKALAGFIFVHKGVRIVRVANNRFKEEGIQAIAFALQMKPAAPLELLDVSLNPMSFQCTTMLAAAFVRCKEKPQTLLISSCGIKGPSASKLVGIFELNRSLTRMSVAANDLSGEPEKILLESLELNTTLLDLDLRRTNISKATQERVNQLLARNKALVGVEAEPLEEIPPLYLNEPEYLIWEYNPNNPDYIPGRYPKRVAEF